MIRPARSGDGDPPARRAVGTTAGSSAADPWGVEQLAAVEARGRRWTTPCGRGELAWRCWGSGVAVLLLHGGFGSWTHWIRSVDALATRHAALALDLPGFGDSDEAPEPVTPESLAGLIVAGLDRLPIATASIHVVGFSFGGAIAGPLCLMLGERVRSLTLVGPGGLGPLRPSPPMRRWRALPDPGRDEAHRHNLASLMVADPRSIDPLAVGLQRTNAERTRFRRKPMGRPAMLVDSLPDVAAPVAAIYGERDATVQPFLAARRRQLRELVPDLEFRAIRGAGHWVQYERADRFNPLVLARLARIDREHHGRPA